MNGKPTPTLRELQQWMAGLIVSSERSSSESDRLAAFVSVPRGCDGAARLRVYTNGYPARLEEALHETFPAVAHVVGAGAFAALAHRFAAAVPLQSYSLSDAGAPLPDWLGSDPLSSELPFLPDLARLEWLVAQAFHAPDDPTFDPATMAEWSLDRWEGALLRFQPWVALVESQWPVREIWEARETPIGEIDIGLDGGPDRVMVRRAGFAVICETLDPAEAHALRLLLAGVSLGEAVSCVADRGDDPSSVSAWFARWISLRMIAGCAD